MTVFRITVATLGAALLAASPLPAGLSGFGAAPAYARGNGGGHGGGGGGGHGGGGNGGNHGSSGNHGNGHSSNASTSHGQKKTASASGTAVVEEGSGTGDSQPKNAHGLMASELKGLNAYHASETAFENAAPDSQVGRIATYRKAAMATEDAQAQLINDQLALDAALANPDYQGPPSIDDLKAAVADDTTTLQQAQQTEQDALDTATGGRTLSDAALAYFREQLNL
jgi:hypothetical protein